MASPLASQTRHRVGRHAQGCEGWVPCCAGKAQLKYNWSNVCMQYFTCDFLARVAEHVRAEGVYHIAQKKIPSKDGPVQVGQHLNQA